MTNPELGRTLPSVLDNETIAGRPLLPLGVASATACVLGAAVLGLLYRTMGGPSDPLYYFRQAERLLPFQDNHYGPIYFVALRLTHALFPLSWFAAGKLLSWLSLIPFLLLSRRLFSAVLGPGEVQLAIALLAINPILIAAGFTVATDLFGACWVLAAVVLASRAGPDESRRWLVSGLLFGLAYLTRFASLGFALGTVLGTVVMPSGSLKARLRSASLLLVGGITPPLIWNLFLFSYQGYVPANHNFIHLTMALGGFREFRDVPDLIAKYGSLLGVLTSDWTAAFRIAVFGMKQAFTFPYQIAPYLFFVGAGFLVPGLLLIMTNRRNHRPWLGAFLVGTFLLGIGSRDWVKYYVVILPFGVILIVTTLRACSREWSPRLKLGLGTLLVAATAAWTAFGSREALRAINWTELALVRAHLDRVRDSSTVMASTTETLSYGSTIPYVRLDTVYQPPDSLSLADILRRHGVTHLVLLRRHSLWEYSWLAPLLEDPPRTTLPGLQLDTLIRDPERVAVYRVEPGKTGSR